MTSSNANDPLFSAVLDLEQRSSKARQEEVLVSPGSSETIQAPSSHIICSSELALTVPRTPFVEKNRNPKLKDIIGAGLMLPV